jgi:hypothetical protein
VYGYSGRDTDSESEDELPPLLVRRCHVYGNSDSDTDSDDDEYPVHPFEASLRIRGGGIKENDGDNASLSGGSMDTNDLVNGEIEEADDGETESANMIETRTSARIHTPAQNSAGVPWKRSFLCSCTTSCTCTNCVKI